MIVNVGYLLLKISLVNGGLARVIVFFDFFIASHKSAIGDDVLYSFIEHVALVFDLFIKVLEGTRTCNFLIFFKDNTHGVFM